MLKCMLHISKEEQRERLLARLDNPEKYWKYKPGDIDARARWDDYRAAYEIALERTNTEHAPWHVVPSDRKWFRNLAVGSCCSTRCAAWTWAGRRPTSTWTQNGPGCSRRTRAPDPFGSLLSCGQKPAGVRRALDRAGDEALSPAKMIRQWNLPRRGAGRTTVKRPLALVRRVLNFLYFLPCFLRTVILVFARGAQLALEAGPLAGDRLGRQLALHRPDRRYDAVAGA